MAAKPGITFQAEAFVNSITALAHPQLDHAVALALVDTAKGGIVKAAGLISKRTGLRSATVKARLSYTRVPVGQYHVYVKSSRQPIALIDFPRVRQTGAGVSVHVWGKQQTLQSAFISNTTRGGQQVFRRRGASRLPIKKLWGPTIYGTFATPEVQGVIHKTMTDRLRTALLRRIASQMRRR